MMSHRQSGKTSTAKQVQNMASHDGVPKYLVSLAHGSRNIWENLLVQLREVSREAITSQGDVRVPNSATFTTALATAASNGLWCDIIVDEADVLLDHPDRQEFLQCVRSMKQSREVYGLRGLALLGTHALRGILSSQDRISPFTAEFVVNPSRFSRENVEELLGQFTALHHIGGDVGAVAEDILTRTSGHVGLVGRCLSIFELEIWSHGQDVDVSAWKRYASVELVTTVGRDAVYRRLLSDLQEMGTGDSISVLLQGVMVNGSYVQGSSDGWVERTTPLLSAGVVVERRGDAGEYVLEIAAPLIRTLVLQNMGRPNLALPVLDGMSPRDMDVFELLKVVVTHMQTENLVAEEAANANTYPSEYAYQFEFKAKLSAVLSGWFPSEPFRYIPEAKKKDATGSRRCRLDVFVFNGIRIGFELLASSGLPQTEEHFRRSEYYANVHQLDQMVVLHFSTSRTTVRMLPRVSVNVVGTTKQCTVRMVHVVYTPDFRKAHLYHDGDGVSPIQVDITPVAWQFQVRLR